MLLPSNQLSQAALDRMATRNRITGYITLIAASKSLKQANSALRRDGVKYLYRKKLLKQYGSYLNKPDMVGVPLAPKIPNHYS